MSFGAGLAPRLSFDCRLVAVSAGAEDLGLCEFFLVVGSLSFFFGLGRQRDSILFGHLRCLYFLGSLLFGIIGFCLLGTAFVLSGWYWDWESIDEKLSFRTVYPRVGGATRFSFRWPSPRAGLSPRGRGNRLYCSLVDVCVGSIPAWAGQPIGVLRDTLLRRVYPRVGGATRAGRPAGVLDRGLSPRGRGNHGRADVDARGCGSIPAWAGQPHLPTHPLWNQAVYPRVGGATRFSGVIDERRRGLSPRGRGNHDVVGHPQLAFGSIPAWAGQPHRVTKAKGIFAVYPRVGGATVLIENGVIPLKGLSPRGRGNRTYYGLYYSKSGSIPAWAGQPRPSRRLLSSCTVYPRVGGATLRHRIHSPGENGLSPRGRGNPGPARLWTWLLGSIPAWAGQPVSAPRAGCR